MLFETWIIEIILFLISVVEGVHNYKLDYMSYMSSHADLNKSEIIMLRRLNELIY